MPVSFEKIVVGQAYDRPQLAQMWGYKSFNALGRGCFTPRGQNIVVLFITVKQQLALPQYENRFDGELLWMDGEEGHGSDNRLARSIASDQVHLFFRDAAHTTFVYHGQVWLMNSFLSQGDKPSRFVFTTRSDWLGDPSNAELAACVTPDASSFVSDPEGRKSLRLHFAYERSRRNREQAIQIHGSRCSVCQFDFDATYGRDLASAFVEVHHLISVTEIRGRCVDPKTELAPLCANCHRMAHRRRGLIVPLNELRERVARNRNVSGK